MKKKLIAFISILFCSICVYASDNNFSIDFSKFSFTSQNKESPILNYFDDEYAIIKSISSIDSDLTKKITNLTKKTTYLLLGDFNNNESSEQYYKRHQEYLELGLYNDFEKNPNTSSGYNEDNPYYHYAILSEIAVPSMFTKLNNLNIQYNSYGNIRITEKDKLIISTVTLPKITIKKENNQDPMKYDISETNLIITYYFVETNGKYKLAYLFGETKEELESYITEIENNEKHMAMQMISSYDYNLNKIYDYSKLQALTENEIKNVYNLNKKNILILNAYYNNYLISTAHGFFINEGIVITTWDFVKNSLEKAQYITMKDNEGNYYEMDGFITVNPNIDIAIIKLKNKVKQKVKLAEVNEQNVENPVITISSKTGIGITIQKGIILSNNGYIQSSIPLSITDQGSPLFDNYGNVIGLNTAKQINSSISLAINQTILKEIQDKFNTVDFNSIKAVSFQYLKEQIYYVKYNNQLISNTIPKNKWKEYSKIGNIEETIKLKLLKSNYKDKIISLRYDNQISDYISSMKFAGKFKEKLMEDGYKEILNTTQKCIYINKKYQVIIMDEFDYLIVVMVKL